MTTRCSWKFIALLALLVLLLPGMAAAQSIVTGGISGTVTDPTGAVIVGAKITLNNPATGEAQTVTSSASGVYNIALLKPGHYDMSVSRDGFKTAQLGVDVNLGQVSTANVKLETGSVSTTVEVTSQGPLLQTEDANISSDFDTKQIQNIPNPGGDVTYIAQTAPGVTMNNSTGGGYGNFSTFGLPATSNLFTINGNDYNDPFLNLNNSGASNLLLGGNELQEVAVVNNAYTGQYGRQAGSQVDYTTKSGSNAFHGDAVYYWTGRYLSANDALNKVNGLSRPFENNNQWAASLGGPIKKDKAFFFLNTEGIRYIFGSTRTADAPTAAFQQYVMANVPQDAATQAFYSNAFKLFGGAPNIGHATPNLATSSNPANPGYLGSCTGYAVNGAGEIFDPISGAVLPAALQQGGATPGGCTEGFGQSLSNGNREWLISGRVDYSFSDTDKIFGRVRFDRGVQPTYTDSINPAFNYSSTQPQNEGQLNYTHVFSPNVVNNFIGSVLYYSAIFGTTTPGTALNLFPGALAFNDGSLTPLGPGSGPFFGFAGGFLYPNGRNVTQWGLVDDLSITKGNHAFKMGFNWRRDDISDFTASQQILYPGVNTTLLDFANDEVGPGGVVYNFAPNGGVQPVAIYSVGFYFQDQYTVTPNLKLTLTLRADRNSGGVCQSNCATLPTSPFNAMSHADIPYNAADGGSFQTGLHTIIPGNEMVVFQPRFGLAWTPWGRNTVIRTGIGLFSDLYPGTVLSGIDTNFPNVNLWDVPAGTLAWDLQQPGSTAFPNSGVALVQGCNAAFVNNFKTGGNLTSYTTAAPQCVNTLGAPAVPTLNDVARNIKNPKYVQWNFEIQHMIGARTVISADYVGNRGYDLLTFNDDLNGFGYGQLPATVTDPRVGRVNFLQNEGISNYNGVTFSIQENTWHGLSGRLNYTYSHAFDDISNGGVLPFSVFDSIPTQINPYNLGDNYASSDYDARHQISGSYVYDLPFKSENRMLNYAIGGWEVSGTMFWHSGFPFSFIDGAQIASLTGNNLAGSTILLQPEFTQRNFSNVAACAVSACFGLAGSGSTAPFLLSQVPNFMGAVGRNAFRGPGFLGGDMSVRKMFNLNERMNLQISLNAYNWFNHANYGNPFPNDVQTFFGSVVVMNQPPTSPYGAFAAAATDMRIAQLQAKLVF